MDKVLDLIEQYNELTIDAEAIEDNVDEINLIEEELLNSLPVLISLRATATSRRLKSEKKEKLLDSLISKIMKKLNVDIYETEDWVAKLVKKNKYNIDMTLLPDQYKTYSYNSVDSKINKGVTIPWVQIEFSADGLKMKV